MSLSRLAAIWKTLHGSKKISSRLANDFQDWLIEEEFDYEALIDDISDKEDVSSIAQWLRDHNYDKHDEFIALRQLIVPQSHETDMKYDVDIEKKVNIEDASIVLDNINPSDPNISDLLTTLNSHLDFESNPSLVQDLIAQLEHYNKQHNNGDMMNISESHPITLLQQKSIGMISGVEPMVVSGGDLDTIRSALSRLNEYTSDELDEFVRFCKDEEYGEDQLIDDIEVFEEGDSAIIENISSIFNWNSRRAAEFVNSLRGILGLNTHKKQYITPGGPTPNGSNIVTTQSASSSSPFTASDLNSLPKLHEFIVPLSVLRRRNNRCLQDIEDCFIENGISSTIIDAFDNFCIEEKCDEEDIIQFKEVTHGAKLKKEYPQIGAQVSGYVEKCLYELQTPLFKPSTFTKQDESTFGEYIDRECPGVIKHDRDLVRFFLLTKVTEPDLNALLIDTVDRISVQNEYPMDLNTFTSKAFFKELTKHQTTMIKNGLRTYHNRFFPRLTMNPLYLICDKISDFQKYSCILSEFIAQIVDRNIIEPPALVDFVIIPPGVFSKIVNNFTADKCMDLGDIKRHLDDFDNDTYSLLSGLTADDTNFDEKVVNRIVNELCIATQNVMRTVKRKQYQRIVIAVDRRWRVLNNKHCVYNKLRSVHSSVIYDHKVINKDAYDYDEYTKDSGLTKDPGFESLHAMNYDDDDEDDDDDNDVGLFGAKNTFIAFDDKPFIKNKRSDTLYVYQPKTPFKARKLNEFSNTFCHETLMYLTKQCILPRKKVFESKGKYEAPFDDEDKYDHLSGNAADGWMFNLSIHIYKPYPNDIWYKYKLKWYLFTQAASIRVHQDDFKKFWYKYFVDPEKDIHQLTDNELKKYFKFDLDEADVGFKRWFYAIKKTML